MVETAEKFVGAWRLISAVQYMADGSQRNNARYGPGGIGYILYSESGRVCVVNIHPRRPPWERESTPTESELSSAMDGLMAYAGRYEVNAGRGFILHHIEVDAVPNRVGSTVKRFFGFSGSRLILRPAPPLPSGMVDYRITWERVG